tara:strand:+ start:6342 stop:6575 length:234 start_codon:yes stop_codon:yes gene_type:complete
VLIIFNKAINLFCIFIIITLYKTFNSAIVVYIETQTGMIMKISIKMWVAVLSVSLLCVAFLASSNAEYDELTLTKVV